MTTEDNNRKFNDVFSRVLSYEKKVSDETSLEMVPSWDSFNALLLISELEKEFNINFTAGEVVAIKNVRDLKNGLLRAGIEL